MTTSFCQLQLTCANQAEAEKIAELLLNQHLIACAKFVPISCTYWWKGKIVNDTEVLLVMESRQDLFAQVESAVAKVHSYKTFVLQAIPFAQVSKRAASWLERQL